MTISDICIRRPVLATVLNLLVVVVGLISLNQLPIRELPDIDAAAVTVNTTYVGAAPEVIDTQITETVEAAIAGVAGVDTISSTSTRGRSSVRVSFDQGRDIDEAANDIRGAVSRITGRLPEDAEEPLIFKNDSDADPILRVAIVSTKMTASEVTDYAERFIVDRLATLPGVASVTVNGARRFAMRISIDPKSLAARGLTVTDVSTALRENNLELPAGEVESVYRRFQLRAATRINTPDAFADMVLRVVDGAPVRLGDVASVEIGVEDDDITVRNDGSIAVGLSVIRQSQSNTIAISEAIRAEVDLMRDTLPAGMEVFVTSDDAIFIRSSIEEVLKTLGIAVVLVVLVIFLFLGSPRATMVPAVTIPIALIGALSGIYAFGYSINILTLFAMILAIGIVVDDAIVVLENIQRRIEAGDSPIAAAAIGSREVGFAVIATSVTLISVFVPISFLDGQVGRLFTEFGVVLAIAVIFSTFVALSLAPVISYKILRKGSGGMFARLINRIFGVIERVYRVLLRGALGFPIVIIGLAAAIASLAYLLYQETPRELVPKEDRGIFFVSMSAPQGSTTAYTDREVRLAEGHIQPLLESGEVTTLFSIIGWRGNTHRAFLVARLSDWESGRRPSSAIVGSLIPQMLSIPGAQAFPIQPAGLGLRGSRRPLQVKILGSNFTDVQGWAEAMKLRMEDNPSLRDVDIDYEETQPELQVEIARAIADDLGVSVMDIASTLQTFFASREVTQYLDRGREYPVILQATEVSRRTAADLAEVFVRSRTTGALIPMSALLEISEGTASPALNRFNRLPAIEVSAGLSGDYTLGAAVDFVRQTAADTLPPNSQIAFDGQSKEFVAGSGGALMMILFAVVVVYLVLSAQFESFIDPLTILLSAPLAVTGALGAIWMAGLTLNIYTQIGMLLLLGLMAKNGILIVEFANQLRDKGAGVTEAALEGAVRRLRPIMMTVLSTLLGALPLMLSSGAGSEARAAIGIVIIGGFGFASILTLFLTPVLYSLLSRLTKPRATASLALDRALNSFGTAPR